MESEIKLSFKNREELFGIIDAEWFSDFCLDTSPKETVTLDNTYYDTPDHKLIRKGGSIRIRKFLDEDDKVCYEHTVKFGGGVTDGLHQRYEWNVKMDSPRIDLAGLKDGAKDADDPAELLDDVLEGISSDDLVPLCSTVFERTKYMFGFGDSIMEACFDCGKIEAGDKEEDICELELELESGDVVDLKEMGQFIIDNTAAVPFNDSKFKRCLKLLYPDEQ